MNIYVDLDRTLLKTDKITNDIWLFMSFLSGHPLEYTRKQAQKGYYIYKYEMYYYDFLRHFKDVVGKRFDTKFNDLKNELNNKDYLYSDSIDSLERLDRLGNLQILTYGETYFQKFKIEVTGLNQFNHRVIQIPKEIHLREVKKKAILIDDKDIGNNLNDNFRFFLINRTGNNIDNKSVSNLKQVVSYIKAGECNI